MKKLYSYHKALVANKEFRNLDVIKTIFQEDYSSKVHFDEIGQDLKKLSRTIYANFSPELFQAENFLDKTINYDQMIQSKNPDKALKMDKIKIEKILKSCVTCILKAEFFFQNKDFDKALAFFHLAEKLYNSQREKLIKRGQGINMLFVASYFSKRKISSARHMLFYIFKNVGISSNDTDRFKKIYLNR